MTDTERLARIQALWAGDALQDVTLLWRLMARDTCDPIRIVEAIAAAGRRDPAVEVEDDTLAEMWAIAGRGDHGGSADGHQAGR